MTAARIPTLRLSWKAVDTAPASVGPAEQPRSPARAISANISVPPLLMPAAALLNVPGHIMPTDRPQMAQPIRLTAGTGISEMQR